MVRDQGTEDRLEGHARLELIEMADTLYLSLWYPNLRLAGLAEKLTAVLGTFAKHGGAARVYSATVWPVSCIALVVGR